MLWRLEVVVDATSHNVVVIVNRRRQSAVLTSRIRIGDGRADIAEIDVEILGLQAPLPGEHPFGAGTNCPADRCVRGLAKQIGGRCGRRVNETKTEFVFADR
jgi:hypothetical protein